MNNEEKANELAQQCDFTTNSKEVDIAFRAAMKMAEWKDEQHSEIERMLLKELSRLRLRLAKKHEENEE